MKDFKKQEKMTFNEVLEKLETTHKTTISNICNDLKTPRPWVSRYITPFLDKIYLSNGFSGKSLNWNRVAKIRLGKLGTDRDCIYYNTKEYENLIRNSLVSCQRQTISCSPLVFLNDNQKKGLIILFKKAKYKRDSELESNKNDKKKTEVEKKLAEYYIKDYFYMSLFEEIFRLLEENFNKEDFESFKKFFDDRKRSDVAFVDYNCSFEIQKLMAIHDLKGYAGVDEMIYRNLFNNGAVKLVFQFKDNKGNIGKKIFYYYDDDNDGKYRRLLEKNKELEELNSWDWAFPYALFLKYKKI